MKQALPLGAVRTADGDVVVPESRRADGSVRKTIRIRQGYVPQDEVPKYKPVGQRMREQQVEQPKVDADALASGLHTLSLESATTTTDRPSTGTQFSRGARSNADQSRRRPLSPPAPHASSAPSSTAASSMDSGRGLKAELATVNKSLREIAKLEAFAAAAARGDHGSRPLTAAQLKKTQRKQQLEARRQEIVALQEKEANAPTAKPSTLRVVEL